MAHKEKDIVKSGAVSKCLSNLIPLKISSEIRAETLIPSVKDLNIKSMFLFIFNNLLLEG